MVSCERRFFGASIGKRSGMCVDLLEGDGPFQVLYLLYRIVEPQTPMPTEGEVLSRGRLGGLLKNYCRGSE